MELMTQQTIRAGNLRRIYHLIDSNLSISRAKLAKLTKLSKTTVSSLVDELIAGDYVADCGAGITTRQGRKPNILHINGTGNVVAVISWRRNRLDLALVQADSKLLLREQVPVQKDEDSVGKILKVFSEILLPAVGKARLMGVCIVVPGIVDDGRKSILSTVIGVSMTDTTVQRLQEALRDYSLCILNDTACFAYAESVFTRIQEQFYAYVNVSKGVGACLFAEGHMLRGAGAMATQFGHFSVDRNGPVCACGNRGCLERIVGEYALGERAQVCGVNTELIGRRRLLYSDIGKMAAAGDGAARRLIRELAQDLAFGLSNLISMFNPSLIIIGGTGVNLGAVFLSDVTAALSHMGFQEFVSHVQLRYSQLGLDSELTGAAQYFIDHHYNFTDDMRGQMFLR
ncbi:MAG: ROK family protein [Ruthenibacterium sp.]